MKKSSNAKPIKLYWSSKLKNGRKNFGDWLSVSLVRQLSGRDVIHAKPNNCDLVAIGSILQKVRSRPWSRKIHIWGTGFINQTAPVNAKHFYHAVRGRKTAALIKGANISTFGDPGLLAECLLPDYKKIPKTCGIGVVPHYKDRNNPEVAKFAEKIPNTRILEVLSEPGEFLKAAAGCEFILSSSLHGLVIADAFEIPNAWIELSDAVRGNRFKFHDYYSAFGIINIDPLSLDNLKLRDIEAIAESYGLPGLEEIKAGLLKSFPFPG